MPDDPKIASPGNAPTRRSDRVTLRIAVEVSGTDISGFSFHEDTRTESVSRHGGSIVLNNPLAPDQELNIRRKDTNAEAPARVVGSVGSQDGAPLYGIAFLDPAVNLWGIDFGPAPSPAESAGRTLLQCGGCGVQQVVELNDVELQVLQTTERVSLLCSKCKESTTWRAVPAEQQKTSQAEPTGRFGGRLEDLRKHKRTAMSAQGCIRSVGRKDEVVTVIDVSKGGLRFRSSQRYNRSDWIEVAVPFMPGSANIFVPARIAWTKATPSGEFEYGVVYVSRKA